MRVAVAQADASPVPLPPSVLASPLGPIVARATQKDPSRRFASAAEMLEWIDRAGPFGTLPSHSMGGIGGMAVGSAQLGSAPTQAAPAAWGPTTGAVVVPRRPPTQQGGLRPWMVIGALGAMLTLGAVLVVGAFAAGVLTASDGNVETEDPARARRSERHKRNAAAERSSSDAASSDEGDGALDEAAVVPEQAYPCRQSNPALARYSIRGLTSRAILERLSEEGYPCMTQLTMGRCVQVTSPGSPTRATLLVTFCTSGGANTTAALPGSYFAEDAGNTLAIVSTPDQAMASVVGRAIFDDAGASP
jgi:hypothetical protein